LRIVPVAGRRAMELSLQLGDHEFRCLSRRARREKKRSVQDALHDAVEEYLGRTRARKLIYGSRTFKKWDGLKVEERATMKDLSETQEEPGSSPAGMISVDSYPQLVAVAAFLSVMNKTMVLLFRGQRGNWEPTPALFRREWTPPSKELGAVVLEDDRAHYLALLAKVGDLIYPILKRRGLPRWRHLKKRPPARWAVIQHYELWPTPLLDFTTSLRVAASFAFGCDSRRREGFLFIVGVDSISSDLMTHCGPELAVRLNSVCPPSAVRPHLQDGVLVGRYSAGEEVSLEPTSPLAGAIPIATVQLRNEYGTFWGNPDFPIHSSESLLPSEDHDDLLHEFRSTLVYTRDDEGRAIVAAAPTNFRA
jgi:hypothetical protein